MKRISSYKTELVFIFACLFIVPFFYILFLGIQSKDPGIFAVSIPAAIIPGALAFFLYRVERTFYFDRANNCIVVKRLFGKQIVKELNADNIQRFDSKWFLGRRIDFFTTENEKFVCNVAFGKYRFVRAFLNEIS